MIGISGNQTSLAGCAMGLPLLVQPAQKCPGFSLARFDLQDDHAVDLGLITSFKPSFDPPNPLIWVINSSTFINFQATCCWFCLLAS